MPVIELIALALAVPGAISGCCDILTQWRALGSPTRRARRPGTTELAVTLRLRVRRS